jgi:leucyl aminopeptidase
MRPAPSRDSRKDKYRADIEQGDLLALEIVPTTETPTEVTADVVAVGATNNGGDFALGTSARSVDDILEGGLSEHLDRSGFKAKIGSVAIVPTFGRVAPKTVAVVGLGSTSTDAAEVRRAAGNAARRLSHYQVAASTLHEGGDAGTAAAAAEGWHLGSYRFNEYKSDPKLSKLQRVLFLGETSEEELTKARARAEASITARDLTNEPASTLWPETMADRARAIADANGLEITVLDENDLQSKGFGGLLAVGQGSVRPPRLIQLRHAPENPSGKVALVGKGVTFDSGGLSLKDAKSMETMKTDMAGGAAVLGAMSALKRLAVGCEVIGIVPATENLPGDSAIKPGDVIRHYGGQTSEVLNTDAEGRLILADGLAYASELQPDAILDVATLTGAMMVALGRKAAGYFSNNDALAKEIEVAASRAGERVWRMPLFDDYRSDMDSDIADIKNIGTRWGGAIYGALYLRDFVAKDIPWGHIDIAGPARVDSDQDEVSKGGSGVAARTLIAWLEERGRAS